MRATMRASQYAARRKAASNQRDPASGHTNRLATPEHASLSVCGIVE